MKTRVNNDDVIQQWLEHNYSTFKVKTLIDARTNIGFYSIVRQNGWGYDIEYGTLELKKFKVIETKQNVIKNKTKDEVIQYYTNLYSKVEIVEHEN